MYSSRATLGCTKFEFEQDLPSLYQTAIFCTVRRLNQTNIRQGSIFLQCPVGGRTITTPMERSDFLKYSA